jgi:hypothetical protein
LIAAKAFPEENILVNPVEVGAPVPPKVGPPQEITDPSALRAAKAP